MPNNLFAELKIDDYNFFLGRQFFVLA